MVRIFEAVGLELPSEIQVSKGRTMSSVIKDFESETREDPGVVGRRSGNGRRRRSPYASDRSGDRVPLCKRSQQAIESAMKVRPTVILQDLVMPGVNGLDLLKEYRNNPLTRAVPVIVLSSKDEPASNKRRLNQELMITWSNCRIESNYSARIRMHSEAYTHELQRQRAYRALEASQRELTEKNCELEILNQKLEEATVLSRYSSQT